MFASRVSRSLLRAVPAVLLAVLAAATFTAVGGVATAAPMPGIPGIPSVVHKLAFVPGQNTCGASGSIAGGQGDSYAISTAPGQHLAFDITSQNNNAAVSVAPLVGPQIAAGVPHADIDNANGADYQVVVSSTDGNAADYTLTVTLS
ncbi:hypothetical protein [Nocardia terpenica]|uniref:Uncharacterized protein n=1 Tax=Nocardia terpenica TaxID=455432 RepID=A0A6G9Z8N3_9NOCA|nr:hypothetical protein [Nocardia terpenica]QIS21717.1 hypothetical protein F6W96_28645 [Nocardia terpenica]